EIESHGSITITSTADASAEIEADTEREVDPVKARGGTPFVMALGVSNAIAVSHVNVASEAEIRAGTTANINAIGRVKSVAQASSGLANDGSGAGFALGLQFSKADITTTINGKVEALADPHVGYTVKNEIDPTVRAADYESTDTISGLQTGRTVHVGSAS